MFTWKNAWVAFCLRFFFHDQGLLGFHEQGEGLPQKDAQPSWNGRSWCVHAWPVTGPTSSDGATRSSSSTSEKTWVLLPSRVVAAASSQPRVVKLTASCLPPLGLPG